LSASSDFLSSIVQLLHIPGTQIFIITTKKNDVNDVNETKQNKNIIEMYYTKQGLILYHTLFVIRFLFITMGIKYAHALTYGIKELSLKDIYNIALSRIPVDNQNRCTRQRPSIDIDCSLFIRTRGNTNIRSNTTYLLNFCHVLQQAGFEVMDVFDGEIQHHSKRSTIQRQLENERKRIEIIMHKAYLMNIVQTRRSLDSLEERNKLLVEESEIKKKIRTIENCLQNGTIDVGEKLFVPFNNTLAKLTGNSHIK
jgi:hypothetical protein